MTSPSLPIAPVQYDQREERGFRGRVSLEIGKKLNADQAPAVFGGIPNAALRGTDAAFVLTATLATLPFNTVQAYDPRLIVGSNFNLSYPMNVMVESELYVASAAAGLAQATVAIFAGTTLLGSNTRPEESATGQTIYRTVIFSNMPPTQNITIQMSCTKAMTLDLTQSWLWILGLSADPRSRA
jgi:hypothetical protein